MLLHSALFFGALSAATTIGAFAPGIMRARVWAGLPFGLALIALVTWSAAIISQQRDFEIGLAASALLTTAVLRMGLRSWSWLGAQLFAAASLASIAYLLYAASITYAVASDPVRQVKASSPFFRPERSATAPSTGRRKSWRKTEAEMQ